ncbi:isoamylase early set domain-containing protein [Desertimonas flava]|uniref:isoamylase early set domain-containing protein n=1 Tax=Desertimonas flava TaxID=2064846 RepID=UPI001878110D|nr:isoamylase early set domain-containing protein [Desertimonas flava]
MPAGQEGNVIEVWASDSDHARTGDDDEVTVTFTIPDRGDIEAAAVVGDFNDWSETSTPMTIRGDVFTATMRLRTGRRYRFKYLLNGSRWENDWAADDYETNRFGGDDSVLDLRRTSRPESRTDINVSSPVPDRPCRPPAERAVGSFDTDRRALAEFVRVWREDAARRHGMETAH